ncbi:MAG TPA: mismatch repair protein [Candidatus Dormibacteraeota bacterium]|nr:mismatch repair protein [Candidatus Dormibacteraeota bacterium]
MADPRDEYSRRLEDFLATVSLKERRHIRLGNFKLATIAAALAVTWLSLSKNSFASYWLLVPVALYALLAVAHEYVIRARTRAEAAVALYRRGLARIEDRWTGTGETGERFRDTEHVYAEDLDLFGRGSLFELLSTARTPMGEERLARWLASPSPVVTLVERQRLVAELRVKLDLREHLALTGESLRARLNPASLIAWAESPAKLQMPVVRIVAALLSLAAVVTAILAFNGVMWPFVLALILELLVVRALKRRVEDVVDGVACNAEGLTLFANILQRLESEPFDAARLKEFAAELKRDSGQASDAVRRLARVVQWIDSRHGLIAKLLDVPMLYSVQVAFFAEAWRGRWGSRLRTWVDITAEMEALLSLGTYSYEHPADTFPEFAHVKDSAACFYGEEIGHPLIAASRCVRNSIELDSNTRIVLISGSNMSGKSTMLRAVGINAVLAMAGAPVRAKSVRLTPLNVGTRIRSGDSLQEGRSAFYTEILHIRKVFDLASGETPALFLFDELMEGTNSKDRRIGAEGLLRALLGRGAIGLVTTHDLALTEITEALGNVVRNAHFQDYVEAGKMRFDYKLRDGVVEKSNALELMRLIGLQV